MMIKAWDAAGGYITFTQTLKDTLKFETSHKNDNKHANSEWALTKEQRSMSTLLKTNPDRTFFFKE